MNVYFVVWYCQIHRYYATKCYTLLTFRIRCWMSIWWFSWELYKWINSEPKAWNKATYGFSFVNGKSLYACNPSNKKRMKMEMENENGTRNGMEHKIGVDVPTHAHTEQHQHTKSIQNHTIYVIGQHLLDVYAWRIYSFHGFTLFMLCRFKFTYADMFMVRFFMCVFFFFVLSILSLCVLFLQCLFLSHSSFYEQHIEFLAGCCIFFCAQFLFFNDWFIVSTFSENRK